MDRAAREPAFAEATRALQAGQLDRARAQYQALTDRPELLAPCLHQLALIAAARNEAARAMALLGQALAFEPGLMLGYRTLAGMQERAGLLPAAMATLLNLGNALKAQGRQDEAVSAYRHVLDREPLHYGAAVNLGTTLAESGQAAEATACLMRGLRLYGRRVAAMAGFPDALLALLPEGARPDEAELPDGQATGPFEMIEGALTTLGKLFREQGHPDAALACYRRALQEAPGYALAHWNLSIALLGLGEFDEGWREYEWRWRWPGFPEPRRALPIPLWQGETLNGRRILVWSEQGLGDTMQFLPLVSRLVGQGAEVVLEVPATLVRLFAANLPGLTVIERPDHPDTVNSRLAFDYAVPLMSLAQRLGLSTDALPLAQGYLHALPEDEEAWRTRIGAQRGPRIGLVWAGRPQYANDAMRSLPFAVMQELIGIGGVRWYSLQLGPRRGELARLPEGRVTDLAPHLEDFAETAAALTQLDGVVTVDTSVAHLAGAMGVPAWVLLPRPGDWRWGRDGEDSAWYPSLRLCRQEEPGRWEAVLAGVRDALAGLCVSGA